MCFIVLRTTVFTLPNIFELAMHEIRFGGNTPYLPNSLLPQSRPFSGLTRKNCRICTSQNEDQRYIFNHVYVALSELN